MEKKGYKIAYLCRTDPLDKRSNSGTQFYMVEALRNQNNKVDTYFISEPMFEVFRRFLFRIYSFLYKATPFFNNSILFSKFLGIYFSLKLRNKDYDFVFISRNMAITPFLKVDIPILYTSDATFKIMHGYNEDFNNCVQKQIEEADFLEQTTINKTVVQMYPSLWAFESAIKDYNASVNSVFLVPSGANFSEEEIPAGDLHIQRLNEKTCNILFVGNNWEYKGGKIAFQCVQSLRQQGMQAILTVIGCTPTMNVPDWVKVVPFLNKNDLEQAQRLVSYFSHAHLLILPTRFETFGLVFAEACAYSLPILASNTGGVSTSVEDGVNGYLLPLDASGGDYAAKLMSLWKNKKQYVEFSISSRRKFETLLNWNVWGDSVQKIMQQLK